MALAILSPSVATFYTSIELSGAFVSSAGLYKPPRSLIMATFRARYFYSWHGLRILLRAYDRYLLLRSMFYYFWQSFSVSAPNPFFISTFRARVYHCGFLLPGLGRWNKSAPALRTEIHCYNSRSGSLTLSFKPFSENSFITCSRSPLNAFTGSASFLKILTASSIVTLSVIHEHNINASAASP